MKTTIKVIIMITIISYNFDSNNKSYNYDNNNKNYYNNNQK